MNLKDLIILYWKTYSDLNGAVKLFYRRVKPVIDNTGDTIVLNSLKEKGDFYWKHDLPIARVLAIKYKISLIEVEGFVFKIQKLEEVLKEKLAVFKQVNSELISVGPSSILFDNLDYGMAFHFVNNNFEMEIYPRDNFNGWTPRFKAFSQILQKKVEVILVKEL